MEKSQSTRGPSLQGLVLGLCTGGDSPVATKKAEGAARKHSVAQSWVVYLIFDFLSFSEVSRLQGLNRLFYHRRVPTYMTTYEKKDARGAATVQKQRIPSAVQPSRKLVLRDCRSELDEEDEEYGFHEVAITWLFEYTGARYEIQKFSLDIPWCTCRDGRCQFHPKQVFNLRSLIVFFNQTPIGCQPMISYIKPFHDPTKLFKVSITQRMFNTIAKVRAYKQLDRVYFYAQDSSDEYYLDSLSPEKGLIRVAGNRLSTRTKFRACGNGQVFGIDWILEQQRRVLTLNGPQCRYIMKFGTRERESAFLKQVQDEERQGTRRLQNPFQMRFPLLIARMLDARGFPPSGIHGFPKFPWELEHDAFYMDEIPDHMAQLFLAYKKVQRKSTFLLGVKNNELICKRVDFANWKVVDSFSANLPGSKQNQWLSILKDKQREIYSESRLIIAYQE